MSDLDQRITKLFILKKQMDDVYLECEMVINDLVTCNQERIKLLYPEAKETLEHLLDQAFRVKREREKDGQ